MVLSDSSSGDRRRDTSGPDALTEPDDSLQSQLKDAAAALTSRHQQVEKEVCICAAIRLDSGRIIRGERHSDCFTAAAARGFTPIGCQQGFVTSRQRFVTREEGRALQDAAGIASVDPNGYHVGLLFSEDLY